MGSRDHALGSASGAEIEKNGETWALVLVRDLRHPRERVWDALTDPEQLREWAPFDADRNLSSVGTAKLSTVGTPTPHVSESRVRRAEPPAVLELDWGGQEMRWELAPLPNGGTRLRLWHAIDRRYIAMGASGWHVCFDVLGAFLEGEPIGRRAGPAAMKVDGWARLLGEYAKLLGV